MPVFAVFLRVSVTKQDTARRLKDSSTVILNNFKVRSGNYGRELYGL